MALIRYRSCSIEGPQAEAVLQFREALAERGAAVRQAVAQLSNLPASQLDEAVVLTDQQTSELLGTPTDTLIVHSRTSQGGTRYRAKPVLARRYSSDGTYVLGGLEGTQQLASAQWTFEEAGATDAAVDYATGARNATVTGSIPRAASQGPTGYARTFSPGNHMTLPTGTALFGISEGGMYTLGEATIWGWVRPTSMAAENVVASFSSPPGFNPPFTQEQRNTAYGLSIRTDGRVRAFWNHKSRVAVEALGSASITVANGQYAFVGMHRRFRNMTGVVDIGQGDGRSVVGFGTAFTSELQVGHWVQFTELGRFYEIASISDDTHLTVTLTNPEAAALAAAPQTGVKMRSTRTKVYTGRLDGTYAVTTTDGLPMPTGGSEPDADRKSIAKFFIGRDHSRSLGFTGDMDVLSVYALVVSSEADADARIRRAFELSFPDYEVVGNTIKRSIVSDIPNGGTVYCSYNFKTSPTAALATMAKVTEKIDSILGAASNPEVRSISALTQAIGAPDPTAQDDQTTLERAMTRFGVIVANGQPILVGDNDMTGYNALAQTLGSSAKADEQLEGKPKGSFVVVALTELVSEGTTVDACGAPSTTLTVTEKIVGINKNLDEAAIAAGKQDSSLLKIRLWWIGAPPTSDVGVLKLRALGLAESDIPTVLRGSSTDRVKVYTIPISDVSDRLVAAGLTPEDVNTIVTRPDATGTNPASGKPEEDEFPPIDLEPTPEKVAAALLEAMASAPGVTTEGDPSPLDPALLVAATVDLDKAIMPLLPLQELGEAVLAAADEECRALFAVLEDIARGLQVTLQAIVDAIVPFSLKANASLGAQRLAFQKYIPCVSVNAAIGLPPFELSISESARLMSFLIRETAAVKRQVEAVVEEYNDMLCIPKTLIAALRGGVCGIDQPRVIADRSCPSAIDELLDRIENLLKVIDFMIKKILDALLRFDIDLSVSFGSASSFNVDVTIPCVGPVSALLGAFS